MKWQLIEEKLDNQGLTVFTSQELKRISGLTPTSVRKLLIRYIKKGLIQKLKDNRGLYGLKGKTLNPWFVANKLFRPSYVSLETALAHYGAIPESIYGVTSVTPHATRTFQSMNMLFTFHKIKRSAYTGYRPLQKDNATILLAEPEKAMADYLYFVHLGKKNLNDRIRWSIFKRRSIVAYLLMFERKGLVEWAKHVIPNND